MSICDEAGWKKGQQVPFDLAQGKPHRAFGPARNDKDLKWRLEKAGAVRRCDRDAWRLSDYATQACSSGVSPVERFSDLRGVGASDFCEHLGVAFGPLDRPSSGLPSLSVVRYTSTT